MDGYIGQIILFAGGFAPRNWELCQGQLLAITQNTALFSIIGTTYGGDGRTTFGLPDLSGRVPLGVGSGPGLTRRWPGDKGGAESHTLTTDEMPGHTHPSQLQLFATTDQASDVAPDGNVPATSGEADLYAPANNLVAMDAGAAQITVGGAGLGHAHNNMQPYLALNYIICVTGIFPSRY